MVPAISPARKARTTKKSRRQEAIDNTRFKLWFIYLLKVASKLPGPANELSTF